MRPTELLAARSAAGVTASYSKLPEEVHRATEVAIARAVTKQIELGIRPITSGEYERDKFYSGFFEKLAGMKVVNDIPVANGFRTGFPTVTTLQKLGVETRDSVVAVDKIEHVESAYLSEWKALSALLPPARWRECKLTMPPITHLHMQVCICTSRWRFPKRMSHCILQMAVGTAYSASAYTSDKEYFQDLAAAYAVEWQILYDAGLRSIQIDDPGLLFFVSEGFRSGCVTDGVNPDALLDQYIWAHNLCLAAKPKDLHVGIHLCRGNMAGSTHIISGSYERIAEMIFSKLNYDTYYLEYDTDRAGDFEPLRHLPIGKNVVLGVVSTKSSDLEDIEEMVARVYAAAEVIAHGQNRTVADVLDSSLGVSPQCGFASMSQGGGKGMSMDLMWTKLVLVKKLAHRIWGENQGA
jgi:methionine synthase II (cobalamin-independent)